MLSFSVNTVSATALLENSKDVKYSDAKDSTKAGATGNCIGDGSCGLNDLITIGLRVTEIILGLVGSIALVMFVYGGFTFLISGGSSDKVSQGKQILIQSVIALIIIFSSYTIIGYIFTILDVPGRENWASSNWFQQK